MEELVTALYSKSLMDISAENGIQFRGQTDLDKYTPIGELFQGCNRKEIEAYVDDALHALEAVGKKNYLVNDGHEEDVKKKAVEHQKMKAQN